ncbi:uncharacterized protein Z518_06211 [Rhinocladiella mackenziei CBS 650.93]|uniref:DUF1993 domain-containing protein n=1 Tax=Rhinocladiella mackenziei CBS 650.93 TaxID=1442369 RepID=A0A0D2IHT2_9EURO|nr:uncharacterized protein Z518_06211 [Rhinocladiella mackenziei CBS 650.93]KIX05339.1 hypothetical protein Z518_06211 [Rhinocladiella mackenziei CBS 650.93]
MPPITLYDAAVVPVIRALRNLSHILKKGETYANDKGIPHSELLEASIAPDMKPLTFQVQIASDSAKFLAVRVAGVNNMPMEDNEKTFEELQTRITATINFLEAVKKEDFDGKEDNEIMVRDIKFTGLSYVTSFALPNFYFHAVTAYDILRMKGVDIGKKDYLRGANEWGKMERE